MPALTYRSRLLLEESLPFRDGLKLDDGTDGVLLLESLTSDGDVNLFRAQPHTSKLYLAVLAPQVSRVAVLTLNNVTTPYFPQALEYTLVSGDDTKVVAGMTVWVGTEVNDYSLGRVRVRAAPSGGVFFLAENSDIDWSAGVYLTVMDEFLSWPKYPRILSDGTIYKDYALAFTDQTVNWPPVALMGSPLVALQLNSSVTFYLDGSESYATALSATIITYAWGIYQNGVLIPGTNYSVVTPGYKTLTTPADYNGVALEARLTVTDAAGKSHTTHRPFLFVNPLSPAYPYYAYTDFEVSAFAGDTDTGWGANFKVFGTSDSIYFPDGAPVMLYAVERYGAQAIGNTFIGALAPTLFADNASTGSYAWQNTGNVQALDQLYATCALTAVGSSHYLVATGFNPNLPNAANILGITVRVTGKCTGTVSEGSVRLFSGGSPTGSDLGTGAAYTGVDVTRTYGGQSTLWGITPTPAIVNASTFGVGITVGGPGGGATCSIDCIDLTIYYVLDSTGAEVHHSVVKYFGYLLQDTLSVNPQTNEVSFETGSIARVAAKQYGFPTIVQDKQSPATWSEGYALTMRRALLYFLNWHTTILDIADTYLGLDSTPMQIADFPKASLWDMLRNFISSTRNGHAMVTKNGRLNVVRDMMILSQAARDVQAEVMQLQANDWIDVVEIQESPLDDSAFVDWSGLWYEGNPNVNPIPIFSKAPGDAPASYGVDTPVQYQVLDSQLTSNALAGTYRAWLNNRNPKVIVHIAGNWVSAFDPGYLEWVRAPLEGFVTKRGTELADARLVVREMSVEVDTRNGVMLPTLTLEVESPIEDGVIGDYPPGSIPAGASACPLGQIWDTTTRACIALGTTASPYPWADTWRPSVYVAGWTGGVYHTDNFTGADQPTAEPTWTVTNDGLVVTSLDPTPLLLQLAQDPYNPSILYGIDQFIGSRASFYRFDPDTLAWALLWDAKTWATNLAIPSGGILLDSVYFACIITDPNQIPGWLGMIVNDADAPNYTTWFSYSNDYGSTWHAAVKIANSTGSGHHQSVQARGCAATSGGSQTIYVPLATRTGTSECTLYYSTNGGVSWNASAFGSASGRYFYHGVMSIDPNDKTRAWYAGDGIYLYSGTATVETLKLATVGCTTGYNKYALEVVFNPSGSATEIRVFDQNDAVNKKRLYTTTDGGANWSHVDGANLPDNGAPYGVYSLLDASDKLYAISFGIPLTVGSRHLIWASDDAGATWYGKAGSAAGTVAYPADGTGIPYDIQGLIDICIAWNVI